MKSWRRHCSSVLLHVSIGWLPSSYEQRVDVPCQPGRTDPLAPHGPAGLLLRVLSAPQVQPRRRILPLQVPAGLSSVICEQAASPAMAADPPIAAANNRSTVFARRRQYSRPSDTRFLGPVHLIYHSKRQLDWFNRFYMADATLSLWVTLFRPILHPPPKKNARFYYLHCLANIHV